MRKLHENHEVWYSGEFDTLTDLIDHLAIHVASLEEDGIITNVDIKTGDALDSWTATLVILPNGYGE